MYEEDLFFIIGTVFDVLQFHFFANTFSATGVIMDDGGKKLRIKLLLLF